MLRQRIHLSLIIGVSLLAGCTGSQEGYRPLTESEVSSPVASAVVEQAQDQEGSATSGQTISGQTISGQVVTDQIPLDTPVALHSGDKNALSEPPSEDRPAVSAGDFKVMAPSQSVENSKKDLEADGPAPSASTTPVDAAITPLASASRREGMRGSLLSKPTAQPLEIKLLVPHKEFTREGKTKALRVTFDDLDLLKVCNMEPVPPDVMNYLPDWLKNLNGQKIILRGWMFPSGRQEGISSFMFVRDNGICCFGRDPKVYDKLAVTMHPNMTTSYIAGRPFDVEATLLIEPDIEGPEEGMWWLYHLEDARVIDQ